ncbi:MAG: DNA helicase related protein [Puniceicoccaceae bacterium 5H]|nr:MAG: DNA helicase related protein [Puniceicoccaceae bacterium 5H]
MEGSAQEMVEVNAVPVGEGKGGLTLAITAMPKVNLSFHQNAIPVVRELVVENTSEIDVRDLRIDLTSTPEWAEPLTLHLERLHAGSRHVFADLPLELSLDYLATLTDRVRGRLRVSVVGTESGGGAQVSAQHAEPVEVLAFDEWSGLSGLPEILAAFVTPNVRAVEQILLSAAVKLGKRTESSSLDGYQSHDRKRVYNIVASVYEAVCELGLTYSNPPASFETTGQRIRFVDRLLENKLATCLDTTLLFASLLEQAGLYPLLILHKGHAYAGCWLVDDSFPDQATDELQVLRKRVDLDEMVVFETTVVCGTAPASFEVAERQAQKHLVLDDIFQYAIDVHRSRAGQSGIRPLPLQHEGGKRLDLKAAVAKVGGSVAGPQAPVTPRKFSPAFVAPEASVTPSDRMDRWKQKLLDITARNRLLNFKETKRAVPLLCPLPEELENQLAANQTFKLLGCPASMTSRDPRSRELREKGSERNPWAEELTHELKSHRLRSSLEQEVLDARLLELYRLAKSDLEETGANTLFLALGVVQWQRSASEKPFRAPILLLPVRMDRQSVSTGFSLQRLDEETLFNVTLLELLRRDYGMHIGGLDPLPEDESGVDVGRVFQILQHAFKDQPGWEVVQEVWLSQFSFNKFLLWKDLQDHSTQLCRNPVVDHLIHRAGQPFEDNIATVAAEELDAKFPPQEVFTPLSSDSSQLAAVLAAAKGKNFVLHGPPGTGKSQTISNLIAHCLAQGKRILFVAEKQAALNVVHHRLCSLGLGPFCLELHSNKAGKTDVLRQLGEAIDFATLREPAQWKQTAEKLEQTRGKLNGYVQALHRRYANGLSAFDCYVEGIQAASHEAPLKIELSGIELHSRSDLDQLTETCRDLQLRGQEKRLPADVRRALKPVGQTEWTPDWEDAAISLAAELGVAGEAFLESVELPAKTLGVDLANAGVEEIEAVAQLVPHLVDAPSLPTSYLEGDWAGFERSVQQMIAKGQEAEKHAAEFLTDFRLEAVREADLPAILVRWRQLRDSRNPFKFFGIGRWRREALALAQPSAPSFKAKELALHLESALRWQELRKDYETQYGALAPRLGDTWSARHHDWQSLEQRLTLGRAILAAVKRLAGADLLALRTLRTRIGELAANAGELLGASQPVGQALLDFEAKWRDFLGRRDSFREHLKIAEEALVSDVGHVQQWVSLASAVRSQQAYLQDWCLWQEAVQRGSKLGLACIIDAIEREEVAVANAPDVFLRAYKAAFLRRLITLEPALRDFREDEHLRKIEDYHQLDDLYQKLAAKVTVARLSAKLPDARHMEVSKKSELGLIARERVKKTRHKPVRQLLKETSGLIPLLKPCFLMSPLSVAQYLDTEAPPFDLVVFDEASQIPVWDAIGAIARGKQLVVVGDPKQLPPTNFFGRSNEESEPEESEDAPVEDLESILDECQGSGLASYRLLWHYRSRKEGLIAFSNQHYYEGRLQTFPAPNYDHAGVRLVPVPHGFYDKSKTRTNQAEAEAIVGEIVRRLKDPELSQYSLGVVTFSQAQQQLILDLLETVQAENPGLERFFGSEHPEPVFVKNLENVQGDERDVILFSVCYAKDQHGKLSMNFGPLNRSGGERRLNVAVTRAKHEVVVFSTLRSEEIDLTRTKAVGVQHLKQYLAFADRSSHAEGGQPQIVGSASDESAFVQEVAAFLQGQGIEVHTQIGCSGYRLDLGVVSPKHEGRYALGIECDGPTYRSAATARDRDRLRHAMMSGLGWRLHRVWSAEWWRNRPQAEADLLEVVNAALAADESGEKRVTPKEPAPVVIDLVEASPAEEAGEAPVEDAPEEPLQEDLTVTMPRIAALVVPLERPSAERTYTVCRVTRPGAVDDFYDPRSRFTIQKQLKEVVEAESPICESLLFRRVAQAWGFAKVGAKIQETMRRCMPRVNQTQQAGTRFLWLHSDDPARYAIYRVPGDDPDTQRKFDEIPYQEVANAAVAILERYGTFPADGLNREIINAFGFKQLGAKLALATNEILAQLEKEGRLQRFGEHWRLP